MNSENVFEEVAKYANPTRRTFLLGLLGAAITAPAVVSFFGRSGQALGPQSVSSSGGLGYDTNFYHFFYDPSANWLTDPNAAFLCDLSANYSPTTANYYNVSGNYIGNYWQDASGNSIIQEITSNAFYEASGNWVCDPQGQFLYNPSGNWTPLSAPQSGNTPTTVPTTQAPTTTTTTTPSASTESTPSTTLKKLPETR